MKPFFILTASFLLTALSHAQTQKWYELVDDPTVPFSQVQEAFYQEWEGRVPEKGQGYKQFKRLEYYATRRLTEGESLAKLGETFPNYLNYLKTNPQVSAKVDQIWRPVGPASIPTNGGGAGRLTFLRYHPTNVSIMYIGTPNGGLWKSSNGGASWENQNDFLSVIGCSDLLIHPQGPDTMYLATGDNDHVSTYSHGVWKSVDGGNTWNNTGFTVNPSGGMRIFKMGMDPQDPQIILAATTSGLRRSVNGGQSWTIATSGNFRDLERHPGNSQTWYAATTTQVKVSTDNGASWTNANGIPGGVGRIAIAVTEDNPNAVFLLVAKSDNSLMGIYKSTASGQNFTQITDDQVNMLGWDVDGNSTGGQAWYDLAFQVNPSNENEMFVGGVNVWGTSNGGQSWTIKAHWYGANGTPYVHADIHGIEYSPDNGTVYIIHDGGISKTTNAGSSFSDISSNLNISQQYKIAQASNDENLILAGHQDNGTNRMQGSGNWSRVLGGDGMDCLIDYSNNNRMIGSIQNGAHRSSTNGGNNFGNFCNGLKSGTWVSVVYQDPFDPNVVYVGGRDSLVKTTNFGQTYTMTGTGFDGDIVEMAVSPSQQGLIFILQGTGSQSKIIKSEDGGATFTNITNNLPASSKVHLAVDPHNPEHLWVVYSSFSSVYKVWRSRNGGDTWENISSGLPNVPCNVLFVQPQTDQNIYLGNDVGVFYRDSITETWIQFGDSLPTTEITDIDFYKSTNSIVVGTYGRGIWRTTAMNESGANLEELKSTKDFSIYPNPANESFSIKTKLNLVQIELIDMNGKVTPANFNQEGESYRVECSEMSTGIYSVRLTTSEGVQSTESIQISKLN
ncbi:MAG: T9SS type A sorting domain-containing protein [Crocinitomicaceae bacterium]|jgi:hypothetical protein|nr:T9SS type A sorting domain-containing protein [Crocinitomicaceae bacterium]